MATEVDRRTFIALLGATVLARTAVASTAAAATGMPHIDAARLQSTLEQLSAFGRPAGGAFADGVSRIAYSDADIAGRNFAMELMRQAALEPRIDAAGNITVRREGTDRSLKPIVMGSHIDSVPGGGNFDGQVGSMAAIEVVRTLIDHGVATRHPLEVTLWSAEEGGPIGSGAVVHDVPEAALERKLNGMIMRDGVRRIGGDPEHIARARRAPGSLHCYLELHIEQGGTLEKQGVPIGVVDGIVGIDEYDVEIRGFANHAGTTAMADRKDALLAAAKLVEAVREIATRTPGRQVGTVGRFEVFPNAPNVIPGLVKLSVEIRDLSAATVERLGAEISERAQQIAKQTDTEISMVRGWRDDPALAHPEIQKEIEGAAATLGLKTMHLPSGAGHDAQNLAKLGPMGMIFVPSIGGISHSPKEFSRWSDCANGANVLLQTVLRVDRITLKAAV